MDNTTTALTDWDTLRARTSSPTASEENEARAASVAEAADAFGYETRGDWTGWASADPEERDEVLRDLAGNLRWLALDAGVDPDRIFDYGTGTWAEELGDTAYETDGPVLAGFWPTDGSGAPLPLETPRIEAWKSLLTTLDWPGQSAAETTWSEDSLTAVAAAAVAAETESINFLLAEEALEVGGDEAHLPQWNPDTGRIVNAITSDHAVPLPEGTAAILGGATEAVKGELPDLEIRAATAAIEQLAEAAREQNIDVQLSTDEYSLEEARHSVPVIHISNDDMGMHFELNPSMRAVEELKALIEGRSFVDKAARAGVSAIAAFPIRVTDRLAHTDTAAPESTVVPEAKAAPAAER